MEMWLKQSILVLLTALVVSGQVPVILDDEQKRVVVPLGSSVTFLCCLKTQTSTSSPPTNQRLRMVWYLNPSSFNDSEKLHVKLVEVSNKTNSCREGRDSNGTWPTYTLSNATEQDGGWYFCSVTVEIPSLQHFNSSGTEVVITKSKEHTTYPSLPIGTASVSPADGFSHIDWRMWVVLGGCSVILILLLVVCVLLRRRRRRRSREEDPVYANTRPVAKKQPSPRPGPDHLKPVPSSLNPQNQSPGGKYGEGKRRYK